jgi:hypothetical protein
MAILSGKNLEEANLARKKRSLDMFLTPEIEGVPVVLVYVKGRLDASVFSDKQKEVLKRSNVPIKLYKPVRNRIGGFKFAESRVTGTIVKSCVDGKSYFLAENLQVKGQNPFNRILRLNLLHDRGFLTVLPLCSWLATQVIVNSRDGEKHLKERLFVIREVAEGTRPNYWDNSTLFRNPRPCHVSEKQILGLHLHDDMGCAPVPVSYSEREKGQRKQKLDKSPSRAKTEGSAGSWASLLPSGKKR